MPKNFLKALYAGSFDPMTLGHQHVVNQAVLLFDEVLIGVGTNPMKKTMFSSLERANMLRFMYGSSVQVIEYSAEYTVHVALKNDCTHIIRGIRNPDDCKDELVIAEVNRKMTERAGGNLFTIFIPCPPELAIISSSFVKSLIGFEGWEKEIARYLPAHVPQRVIEKVKLG